MREVIIVVLWISHFGINLGEADSWEECVEVMSVLEKIDIDASCHAIQVSIRPKRRPW